MENELENYYDMLIEYGARFSIHNNKGGQMLLSVITKQNIALCEKLLRNGMTKNTKDCPNPSSSFKKAIYKIIEDDLLQIYNLLKKYFGNLGFLMKTVRKTIIHDVIYNRNYEMLRNLIRDGVDINIRDSSGNFPIHTAAQTGDDNILSLLLRNNASINATNHAHQTALHLAAQNGHTDAFDTLQLYGLKDSADRFGKTAEDYARENGNYDKIFNNHDTYRSIYR